MGDRVGERVYNVCTIRSSLSMSYRTEGGLPQDKGQHDESHVISQENCHLWSLLNELIFVLMTSVLCSFLCRRQFSRSPESMVNEAELAIRTRLKPLLEKAEVRINKTKFYTYCVGNLFPCNMIGQYDEYLLFITSCNSKKHLLILRNAI